MNMAEDQVDETVKGRSFGEETEREAGDEGNESEVEQETENTETESQDNQEETQGDANETESEEETEGETEGEKPELTEKGTKKDPNPKSAVHQELANEKKVRGQMEQVLGDPELLAKFAEERYGIKLPVKGVETKTEDKTTGDAPELVDYKAEDFENLDDVANKFNNLQKTFIEREKARDAKIEELTKQLGGIADGGKRVAIANNITQGVSSLSKEPELDPKSPDFIPGLDEEIASRFNQLDYDPVSKVFKGQHSIENVGQEILKAVRLGRKSGSLKAQTIVKDKSQGKIKDNVKANDVVDTDKMKPGESIAQGIAKMMKGR